MSWWVVLFSSHVLIRLFIISTRLSPADKYGGISILDVSVQQTYLFTDTFHFFSHFLLNVTPNIV